MTLAQRLEKIVTASPEVVALVDRALEGRLEVPKAASIDISSITFRDAARESRISVPTLYRLVDAGKIATIRLTGARRILRQSLVDYMLSGYRKTKERPDESK